MACIICRSATFRTRTSERWTAKELKGHAVWLLRHQAVCCCHSVTVCLVLFLRFLQMLHNSAAVLNAAGTRTVASIR